MNSGTISLSVSSPDKSFFSHEYLQLFRQTSCIRYSLQSLMHTLPSVLFLPVWFARLISLLTDSLSRCFGGFVISLPNVSMSKQSCLPLNLQEFTGRQCSKFMRLCASHSLNYLFWFTVCLKKTLSLRLCLIPVSLQQAWEWHQFKGKPLKLSLLSLMEIWLLAKPYCTVTFSNYFSEKASMWLTSSDLMLSPLCRASHPTSINLPGKERVRGGSRERRRRDEGQRRAMHGRVSSSGCPIPSGREMCN